jgi:hypothetical protein
VAHGLKGMRGVGAVISTGTRLEGFVPTTSLALRDVRSGLQQVAKMRIVIIIIIIIIIYYYFVFSGRGAQT